MRFDPEHAHRLRTAPNLSNFFGQIALPSNSISPFFVVIYARLDLPTHLEALRSSPQSAVRRGSPNTKPPRRHMNRFLPSSVFVPISSVTVPQAARES